MNLGETGQGCPRCGREPHEGECLPFYPRFPENRKVREGALPPTPFWWKVLCWLALAALACYGFSFLLRIDKAERMAWRADWLRRTELCEAQGGIPRYQVRGRSYEGCDFQPKEAR